MPRCGKAVKNRICLGNFGGIGKASRKGIFILFGAMGMATMWAAVFSDMGTALAAIANSTRISGKNSLNKRKICSGLPGIRNIYF
jgi:hypothetical protein